MSLASLERGADGHWSLSGELDYRTGAQLRKQGQRMIAEAPAVLVLDCAGVSKSSSVGLSLLLCFMRDAAAAGKALEVRALPEEMRQMAQVNGIEALLPLQAA